MFLKTVCIMQDGMRRLSLWKNSSFRDFRIICHFISDASFWCCRTVKWPFMHILPGAPHYCWTSGQKKLTVHSEFSHNGAACVTDWWREDLQPCEPWAKHFQWELIDIKVGQLIAAPTLMWPKMASNMFWILHSCWKLKQNLHTSGSWHQSSYNFTSHHCSWFVPMHRWYSGIMSWWLWWLCRDAERTVRDRKSHMTAKLQGWDGWFNKTFK